MFLHQGPSRSDQQNRIIAGYLAYMGGFVNSAGFVIIGTFTSHVTGNVGRFANDLATLQFDAAALAFTMIVAFGLGAFLASMAIESNFYGRTANAYGVALLGEAFLLLTFTALSRSTRALAMPRLDDLEAAILCCAMGMQNSLVTRLSGAVVRTTHLTGVLTDIGIESARWFRWWRRGLSERLRLKLSFGRNPAEEPSKPKLVLLVVIGGSFTFGAMAGAALGVAFKHAAMLVPSLSVAALGVYALRSARRPEEHAPDSRK